MEMMTLYVRFDLEPQQDCANTCRTQAQAEHVQLVTGDVIITVTSFVSQQKQQTHRPTSQSLPSPGKPCQSSCSHQCEPEVQHPRRQLPLG